jgi:hypothetical protein
VVSSTVLKHIVNTMHLGYMKILLFHIKNTELPIILNDFDEKVRKMAEIIIEKPSMQKVIYKLENPSDELAFAYYILFICSNAFKNIPYLVLVYCQMFCLLSIARQKEDKHHSTFC